MSRTNSNSIRTWSWGGLKQTGHILFNAGNHWIDDRCATMSASVAFYAAFSLAPTLVIVIAVAGFFFGADAVQGRLFTEIRGLMGDDGATAIQAAVANAWKADRSQLTAWISVIAIIIGASATFSELNFSLNQILHMHASRRSGVFTLLRVRLISFGLVIGVGFLIVVLLILDAALAFTAQLIWHSTDTALIFVQWLQSLLTLVCLIAAFSALLKALPDQRMDWFSTLIGAAASALLFTAGKQLFALYLAQAGTANAFGAAGSLAVILMWLYYSTAVFLFGAEITAAVAAARGLSDPSRAAPASPDGARGSVRDVPHSA